MIDDAFAQAGIGLGLVIDAYGPWLGVAAALAIAVMVRLYRRSAE